uniref:Uncharacterized protein n=1 Tax=Anas platyrhynchos platyrhynchos TaxID=8840 RepID=A0A493T0U0_ANAPP
MASDFWPRGSLGCSSTCPPSVARSCLPQKPFQLRAPLCSCSVTHTRCLLSGRGTTPSPCPTCLSKANPRTATASFSLG